MGLEGVSMEGPVNGFVLLLALGVMALNWARSWIKSITDDLTTKIRKVESDDSTLALRITDVERRFDVRVREVEDQKATREELRDAIDRVDKGFERFERLFERFGEKLEAGRREEIDTMRGIAASIANGFGDDRAEAPPRRRRGRAGR